MKKTTALVCLLVFSTLIFAQKKFQLGFHFSPNIGWVQAESETIESDGSKIGFSYGIIADFNIADNYSISTGVNLLNLGAKFNYPDMQDVNNLSPGDEQGRTSADIRFSYIQIPLTLKLKTNQIGYMKYYGQFGFSGAVLYDTKADTDFNYPGSDGTSSKEDISFDSEANLIRASLMVGLGAEYNISGNTSLVFGVTYDNGLTNIFDGDGYNEDANGNATGAKDKNIKAFNKSIVLNLGVLF